MILLATYAHATDCPTTPTAAELQDKFTAAETAYATFEVDAFSLALDEAALMLPCLAEPVTPALAAQTHRVRGLRAFIERDPTRANQSFTTARALEPAYDFPTTLIPAGHSLRKQYQALPAPTTTKIAEPLTATISFDGTQTLDRPDSATILQLSDNNQLTTRYLFPGDPLPPYKSKAPPIAATRTLSPKVPLAIGAGVAAVAAGVMYGLASDEQARFDKYDESYTSDDLTSMQSTANGLVIGSAAAGALAVAGTLGVVFVGQW